MVIHTNAAQEECPVETYEADEGVCSLCGETYELRELDRGQCPTCADFADCEEWMY